LVITQEPDSNTTGHTVSPITVSVQDAFGNLVANDSSSVSIALSGSDSSALLGTATVNAVSGVATFSGLTINAGGDFTLTVSDSGLTSDTTTTVTAPAWTTVLAGTPLSLASMDASQSTSQIFTVSVISGPAGATISGVTKLRAKHGVVNFKNLRLKTAGQYTLQVSDADGTMTTQTIVVAPSLPNRLKFVQQPTVTNGMISAIVEVTDAYGNVVSDNDSPITLHLGPYEAWRGSKLGGQYTVNGVNGVAIFSNITARLSGLYRLFATASHTKPTSSTIFKVA
jgi:hypothetical protein